MPEPAGSTAAGRVELLQRAREQYAAGAIAAAWNSVKRVVELARHDADPIALADAALVIRPLHNRSLRRRIHRISAEALDRLQGSDAVRAARLQAQLVATRGPLADDLELPTPGPSVDPEVVFLRLQARHVDARTPTGLGEQLVLADHAIELGRRCHVLEYLCWGRRWRMDAYATLGERSELAVELAALTPVVERLGQPRWHAYVLQVRASTLLLEGRFADALGCNRRAVEIGGTHSDVAFVDLILRSAVARQGGVGSGVVVAEVRRAAEELHPLARGWLAVQLVAAGRLDEAEAEWEAVRPLLSALPADDIEVLVLGVGYARLAVLFRDSDIAQTLYELLLPFAGLQAITLSRGSYEGPVALALGRLAGLLGRSDEAYAHLAAAERSCAEQRAWPQLAATRAVRAAMRSTDPV